MALVARSGRHNLKGQPASRRYQIWTDQHGRQWGSEIEIKTGDPTGVITPIGWAPPDPRLLPDQKYIQVLIDDGGRPIAGQLVIQYEQWMQDLEGLHQQRTQDLASWASKMYGDRAAGVVDAPTPEMLVHLGIAPPAREPVYAMSEGDKWALGIKVRKPAGAGKFKMVEAPKPSWADKYLPPLTTYARGMRVTLDPEFLAVFNANKSQKDDETDAEREARARAAGNRAAAATTAPTGS